MHPLGLHWQNPIVLITLPFLWILCYVFFKQRHQGNNWKTICDPHLLTHLLTGTHTKIRLWSWIMLASAWTLACLALAGPSLNKQIIPTYKQQQGIIILFDASPAMYTNDISPNRLTRARYKAIDLLKQLKKYNVGMIVFSGEAYVVSPITEDSHTIEYLVSELSPNIMPVSGYNLSVALQRSQHLFEQANIQKGKIIVITAGPVSTQAVETAKSLHEKGIEISVLAVGSEQGTPIKTETGDYIKDSNGNILIAQRDTQGLQQLAHMGGGQYANFSSDDSDIEKLFPNNTETLSRFDKSAHSNEIIDWKNQGYLLVYPILLVALICFRRGWINEILK